MSIVSLLRLPTTPRERLAFVFEHDQAHRRQNKRTYLLYPMQNENRPGSKWHFDHQQAHNAMRRGPPPKTNFILMDSNLFRRRQKLWWEFTNYQEHLHP